MSDRTLTITLSDEREHGRTTPEMEVMLADVQEAVGDHGLKVAGWNTGAANLNEGKRQAFLFMAAFCSTTQSVAKIRQAIAEEIEACR